MKAMKTPHPTILLVSQGVMVLLSPKGKTWEDAKKMFVQVDFLTQVRDFNRDSVTQDQLT